MKQDVTVMNLSTSLQTLLEEKLREQAPGSLEEMVAEPVGGGSINQTIRVSAGGRLFFCKINSATKFPQLFQREQSGLALLRKQDLIRVPDVLDLFEGLGCQFLLLEWIRQGERTPAFWKKFGAQLAALHQVRGPQFGGPEDNYMGSLPQSNTPEEDWTSFFIRRRLEPMIQRCLEGKLLTATHQKKFERLYHELPGIFDRDQMPSLVHGDLWSGNFMCDDHQQPVLIDPAVYYGHPAVDLGMTRLFGGFPQAFYEAYQYFAPLSFGREEEWAVCNLYPLLIHLFLFGSSYLPQIIQTLDKF
ncbi:MAG: fructosamine kinase family protein [Flavisolibacter sp.]